LKDYDLIIVGGGPAGAAAALYAARHSLRALIVDKARFPRDKICGDAVSGKSVAILSDLGLLEQVRALPGAPVGHIVFAGPDHTEANIPLDRYPLQDLMTGQTLPMEGFVIRRAVFDDFLFQQAKACSTECLEEFTVEDVLWDGDQVVGIRGTDGTERAREFTAPLVLGCDGYRSIIAQKVGLYKHESAHWMVALRQYWRGVSGLTDQIELHFIDEVRPGYFWIFPADGDRANIGIGMGHQAIKQQHINLKEMLANAIASPAFRARFADAQPVEQPVGWNLPVATKRRTAYGNGFLLLGDAAGLIDPFTGEGISNALYSARTAIDTALVAGQTGDYSGHALRPYEDKLWQTLGSELRISTQLHQLVRSRTLTNFLIHKAARSPYMSDLICGMMANAVPRKHLINPLFYLKLLFK
jgi:geranylgeranyl reductase family protein